MRRWPLDADGNKHRHQWRLSDDVLTDAALVLMKHEREIEACKTFGELIRVVERRTQDVTGFGKLANYDTALRIGAFLNKYPEKVYLHRGAKKGWRALGYKGNPKIVGKETLPDALRVLSPHEIEDFLCIYKGRLRGDEGMVSGCDWETVGRSCGS